MNIKTETTRIHTISLSDEELRILREIIEAGEMEDGNKKQDEFRLDFMKVIKAP